MSYEEINNLMKKCIEERNNSNEKNENYYKALIRAEEALRNLKKFY